MALIAFLTFSLLLSSALGELICEELPIEICSYSIASSGKRCLLESYANEDEKKMGYECKTSEVVVETMKEWIESEECVNACGLDRSTIGISSDSLFQSHVLTKLCSNSCHQACPNIVNLYSNLAFGEGLYLPILCARGGRSSNGAAPAPYAAAPDSVDPAASAPSSIS